MPRSVLEAVKMGFWDFEPAAMDSSQFDASDAMPGTQEKVAMLAERLSRGMPLWHEADRNDMEAPTPVRRKPR